MTSESVMPKARKRDQIGRLFQFCIGRRKPASYQSDSEGKYGSRLDISSSRNRHLGRSRSLESLPPILLVPSEEDNWSTRSALPVTEGGAVILHHGHGRKRVTDFREGRRKSATLDESKLSVLVAKEGGTPSSPLSKGDGKEEEEEEELRGWNSPDPVEACITVTTSSEDTSDAEVDGLSIELPTIRRPTDAPPILESAKGSSLAAMKHRASITTV